MGLNAPRHRRCQSAGLRAGDDRVSEQAGLHAGGTPKQGRFGSGRAAVLLPGRDGWAPVVWRGAPARAIHPWSFRVRVQTLPRHKDVGAPTIILLSVTPSARSTLPLTS